MGGSSNRGGGGNIDATLHSCEALVQYRPEDEYCEDKMRPYPLDRLLAVRAGMGTGVFCLGGWFWELAKQQFTVLPGVYAVTVLL